MSSTIKFFDPADPLGLSDGWEIQSSTINDEVTRLSGLGKDGDEVASHLADAKGTLNVTYKNFGSSGNLVVPDVGTVTASGWHVDNISVAYSSTDWPTLTVTAHKHTGDKNHGVASCRTYSPTVELPAQICCPSQIDDAADGTVFEISSLGIAMRSLTYTLACTHVDETGGCGDWIAGDNHDGVETLDAEFTGVPESGDLTVSAAWDQVGSSETEGNTAANTASLSITRHVAANGGGGS